MAQDATGWEAFLRGHISCSLTKQQEAFFRQQQHKKKECCGAQWARRLIRFMWREFHTLWKQWNDDVHGKASRRQGLDNDTQRAHMALTALCDKAPHLLEADRRFFDAQPLAERLQAPNRAIKGWVATLRPVVNKGLWRASEHDRLHNRDL
jgi:hypothetical protein